MELPIYQIDAFADRRSKATRRRAQGLQQFANPHMVPFALDKMADILAGLSVTSRASDR